MSFKKKRVDANELNNRCGRNRGGNRNGGANRNRIKLIALLLSLMM